VSLMALSAPSFRLFNDLRREFDATPELHDLMDATTGGGGGRGDKRHVVDGLVTVHGHVYVSSTSSSKLEVLASAHRAGH
jgi:hypothetical protein